MFDYSPAKKPLSQMEIEYADRYLNHGCQFYGNLAIVRYWEFASHGFNSAYSNGGIFDASDYARKLVTDKHPQAQLLLGIPDVVFLIPNSVEA